MNNAFFEMRHISKSFPGVKALDDVGFSIAEGEVRALVGENGAGKSTLMKILNGNYKKDEGQILIDGKEVDITDPLVAAAHGISIIFQELNLVDQLSIAENIFAGRLSKGLKRVNWKEINRKAKELLDRIGFDADPRTEVGSLTVAGKQMVEIAKALSRDCRIILMDEPSATLTKKELNALFDIIRDLKKRGIAVIYISHRMEEIFEICDTITVLRDGETIQTAPTSQMDSDKLINLMVNRQIKVNTTRTRKSSIGETVLSVKGLSKKGVLRDVSFEVHKGEILGMFGLVGAGRTEAVRAMLGVDRYDTAEIRLDSKPVVFKNIGQALAAGVALVPEERRKQGILPNTPIYKNVSICNLKALSRLGLIDKKKELEYAKHCTEILGVACSSVFQNVGNLSGGNQQKVVISKYIDRNIRVLILDEPTRGIDVGAKDQIYEIIEGLAQQGMAVIVISSEIPELQLMCDRICVMSQGKVTTVIDRSEFADSDNILRNAIGI